MVLLPKGYAKAIGNGRRIDSLPMRAVRIDDVICCLVILRWSKFEKFK